jgi:hypothetical protein
MSKKPSPQQKKVLECCITCEQYDPQGGYLETPVPAKPFSVNTIRACERYGWITDVHASRPGVYHAHITPAGRAALESI